MLNKRMIRSSGVLFASIVCFLLWVLLHDRIYGEEHEEGDLARREEAAAGDKWNGKAPWLLGVDAEDEVPEPVVQMQTEEPAAPAAEITDAELEKMKIKDLKKFLAARGLECKGCAEKHDYVAMAKEGRSQPLVAEKPPAAEEAPKEPPVYSGDQPQSPEDEAIIRELMEKVRRSKEQKPKKPMTPEMLADLAKDPVAWAQFLKEHGGVDIEKNKAEQEAKEAAEERAKEAEAGAEAGRDEL